MGGLGTLSKTTYRIFSVKGVPPTPPSPTPLGTLSEKKRDYVGKIPKWRTPSPQFGNFHIFLPFFLPFYKPVNWKKKRKIWSGFRPDPPPLGIFPT